MREIDRRTVDDFGVTSLELMQAAARACFQEIEQLCSGNLTTRKLRILCGPGNNGGDGAALGQLLASAGARTEVILFGRVKDTKGDARTNFESVRDSAASNAPGQNLTFRESPTDQPNKELTALTVDCDILVDALFGTGLSRPLDGQFKKIIQTIAKGKHDNAGLSFPFIVSVDVPSGMDADSSVPSGPVVPADLTVTFTAPKRANVLAPASSLNGKLVVANIGSPQSLIESLEPDLFLIEEDDARDWLIRTRYRRDSFKNSHGHVLVIAGSRGYTGAAVLCGNAAMRAGAGLTTIACPASVQPVVASTVMSEVMTTSLAETDLGTISDAATEHVMQMSGKADVIAIGPGITAKDSRTRKFVHSVIEQRTCPVVVDADALNCLSPWRSTLRGSDAAPLILTPHPGEMLRLLGAKNKSALDDRVATVRQFAKAHNVILVLKGTPALIGSPDGRVFINTTGNAGLGTAGSGDTLTGLVAGFLAQEFSLGLEEPDALAATLAALYIGGLAGNLAARKRGMRSMMASDIREQIGAAIMSLDPTGEQPGV
jgi:hydroxyethylthiazole kinase-like uncharacterized protein yjeF